MESSCEVAPAPLLSPLRILLVEDAAFNPETSEAVFINAGHTVRCAPGGVEALKILCRQRFDIILMDVQMPCMDGFTVTRLIRRCEQGRPLDEESGWMHRQLLSKLAKSVAGTYTPVVALTSQSMAEDFDRCFAAGMDCTLAKPLRDDVVLDHIAELVSIAGDDSLNAPTAVDVVQNGLTVAPAAIEFVRSHFEKNYSLPPEKIDQVLNSFTKSIVSYIDTVEGALDNGNSDELGRILHSLKGMLLTMGLDGLAHLAGQAEMGVRNNEPTVVIRPLVDQLCDNLLPLV